MPREEEMEPKDKYSVFARMERKYRKGIHSEYCSFLGWIGGGFEGRGSWELERGLIWVFLKFCRGAKVDEGFPEG